MSNSALRNKILRLESITDHVEYWKGWDLDLSPEETTSQVIESLKSKVDDQPVTIATVIKSPLKALINKDSRIKSCQVCNGGFDYYLIFTDNSKMFMSCGAAGNFISTNLSSINRLIKRQKFEKVI